MGTRSGKFPSLIADVSGSSDTRRDSPGELANVTFLHNALQIMLLWDQSFLVELESKLLIVPNETSFKPICLLRTVTAKH
jgi:hypothetical protein